MLGALALASALVFGSTNGVHALEGTVACKNGFPFQAVQSRRPELAKIQ
jgi:hypothetical protein